MKKNITKCYILHQEHIEIVERAAREHGRGSNSAALRYIIERWAWGEYEAAAHLQRIREQVARDPNVDMLEFVANGEGVALRRVEEEE